MFSSVAAELGATIDGLDRNLSSAAFHKFYQIDLETTEMPVSIYDYDTVLLLDVVEHLSRPEDFLLNLRHSKSRLRSDIRPRMLISTPNVAFFALRIMLLIGRFNYAERGILDITHMRLFTRKSLLKMLEICGFDVERAIPVGIPFELISQSRLARILNFIGQKMAYIWPSGFAFQFFVVACPRIGFVRLLQDAERIT